MEPRRWSPSRIRYGRPANPPDAMPTSMLLTVFVLLFVMQIISNSDQAVTGFNVVRLVRVDVPTIFPVYDPHAEKEQPPLLLGCAYRLQGGENDNENGDVVPTKHPSMVGTTTPAPEIAMDAAIEEVQRIRGLVVKWYFRRNPIVDDPDDPMAKINDNEQVYQWMAGGDGGPLGALIGHAVDVSDIIPRIDKTVLHRIIRVDRPSLDLTGEYRCQVEDWDAERRSAWQPMVVYTPERLFKVLVSDSYDVDDEDVNDTDESGSGLGTENTSTTTTSPPPPVPTTSSSSSAAKDLPTKINITCYASGMHPEPTMSILVNGVMQESLNVVVLDDDGDDDDTNDAEVKNTTITTTTTTTRPRVHHWGRYRYTSHREGEVFRKYSIRATKVVLMKDVDLYRNVDSGNTTTDRPAQEYRPNSVDIECRMRVPGDGTSDNFWKPDRPDNRVYIVRKTLTYKFHADPPPPPDAFTSVSSASSMSDTNDGKDNAAAQGTNTAGGGPKPAGIHIIQSMIVAGVAAATRQ